MNEPVRLTMNDGRTVLLHQNGTWTHEHGAEILTAGTGSGFRNVPWGSPRTSVLASEEGPPVTQLKEFILYSGTVASLDANVFFGFADEMLVRGKYSITEEHANLTLFLGDYDHLKRLLIKKYGTPHNEDEFWANDLYLDDPSEWGMAVGSGHLTKHASWTTDDTEIFLGIMGDNYEVRIAIEYSGKAYVGLEEARVNAKYLEAL